MSPSVCPPKLTKKYKTLHNLSKHYKTLKDIEIRSFCTHTHTHTLSFMNTIKEASAVCRSFLDGVIISLFCGVQVGFSGITVGAALKALS